jgi:hypothetical protein
MSASKRVSYRERATSKHRCDALGFACLAFSAGRYDRPFEYTHHAIYHDGRRRIVIDGG